MCAGLHCSPGSSPSSVWPAAEHFFVRPLDSMNKVILKPISATELDSFKSVRLAALKDSPFAFGSTYAKESSFLDSEWEQRVKQWKGDQANCLLAWDGNHPCGIAASSVDKKDSSRAHLVSMWVAPSHRSLGVGRLLVQGIIDWGRNRGVQTLALMVTSSNSNAAGFYECIGFRKTGRKEPYPNDDSLVEYEMIRTLRTSNGTVTG